MQVYAIVNNESHGSDRTALKLGRMGAPALPMFAHVATPADRCGGYFGPEATVTGVVCGRCTNEWADSWGQPIRHASVEHVRVCYRIEAELAAEAAAEWPLTRAGIL